MRHQRRHLFTAIALMTLAVMAIASCSTPSAAVEVQPAGPDISQYSIVVKYDLSYIHEAATFLQTLVRQKTGLELKIVEEGDEVVEHAINLLTKDGDRYSYEISSDGNNLTIEAEYSALTNAVRVWFGTMFDGGSTTLLLPEVGNPMTGTGMYESGLLKTSQSEKKSIAAGVSWYTVEYTFGSDLPVVEYVIEIEKGAATLINGTPNGGYEKGNGLGATTVEAMVSAKNSGYTVLAGVNADFFNVNTDYAPNGLCVKDGVLINTATDSTRTYFAVMKDGSFTFGYNTPDDATLANIKEAVGGQVELLKDGKIPGNGVKDRHPRTAVAMNEETGTVYLVVVDGRKTAYSNGACYNDLSLMLLDLGATRAINLDGGGSSTFVVSEYGSFKTKNTPSDGSLRKVYNSLLVVAN